MLQRNKAKDQGSKCNYLDDGMSECETGKIFRERYSSKLHRAKELLDVRPEDDINAFRAGGRRRISLMP